MNYNPLTYIDKEKLLSEDSLKRIQGKTIFDRNKIRSFYSIQEYIEYIICEAYIRHERSWDVSSSFYLISEFIKKSVGYIEIPNSYAFAEYISEIINNEICKNFPDVSKSFIDPLYLKELEDAYSYIIIAKPFTKSISIAYLFMKE